MQRGLKRFTLLLFGWWMIGIAPAAAQMPSTHHDPITSLVKGLIDQNGQRITAQRFERRFVLVNFIFTGCGTSCPTQTAQLAKFHNSLPPKLRSQVTVLSISVDPGNDKPARLKAFARAHGADAELWTFATGRPDRIMRLLRDFVALRPQDDNWALHTTEVRLFDTRHRMIQRYSGSPLAATQIRADLNALVELAKR